MIITALAYWRDLSTLIVYRQETYDDGSVSNPMPTSGAEVATEEDYYVGLGQGKDETGAWVDAGIQNSGG